MSKKKPTKEEMTSNLLGGLGLDQIEEGLYGKVEQDTDLERELHELLGSDAAPAASPSKQRRPAASTSKSPQRLVGASASVGSDNEDDDIEIEVDENDPELLNELQGVLNDGGGGSPATTNSPQKSGTAAASADIAALISDRLQGYQRLLSAAPDASKRRRLERSVQGLTAALADARAGRPVDLDELPPEPPAPPPPQAQAQQQPSPARVHQAVLNYINPTEQPPAAGRAVAGREILGLLEQRCREYRTAAAAAKAAGQSDEALELLRVFKQFEAAIEAVKAGETVDPEDVPGPPPPLTAPAPAAAARPAAVVAAAAAAAAPAASSSSPAVTGGSLSDELTIRRAAYQALQDKAKESGDSSKARRMGRIIGQYAEAAAALKAGAPYDFATLPPPPGLQPLAAGAAAAPAAASSSGSAGAAPSAASAAAAAAATMGGKAGAQLRQLMARQQQYRHAAVQAKRRGDLATAKRMLTFAKGCEPMLQAAQAGMPVDLSQLPPLPGESSAAAAGGGGGGGGGVGLAEVCEAPKELQGNALKDPERVYEVLEKTLTEKLAVAEENARKFKSMGQIATADRWAKLARSATADLDYLLSQKRMKRPPPKFSFVWQSVSAVRCNPDLGENTLEVRVINGISLPLPDGFKEGDLDTQVKIELPISTESPLSQSTGWVKGSANPGFDCTTRFEINRKARSTARVFKTRGLKFDVIYKRGFLKKDGQLGSATMKLESLEDQCTLHRGLDLMEGRKAVGGRLEVQVRLREPLAGVKTDQVREQWLVLEHSSQELPPSRQGSAAGGRSSVSGGGRSGRVPDCSSYVLQYEIGLLKPHSSSNPKAAEAVRGLEKRLAAHKQALAGCSDSELRQYCSVLQQLAATYGQHARTAVQQDKDRGKAEKFLRKKKEAEREFQDVSSRLR